MCLPKSQWQLVFSYFIFVLMLATSGSGLLAQNDLGKLKEEYINALNEGDLQRKAESASKLAAKYQSLRDHNNAILYSKEALSAYEQLKEIPRQQANYIILAESYRDSNQLPKSIEAYRQVMLNYRKLNDKKNYYRYSLVVAELLIRKSDYKNALGLLRKAEEFGNEAGADSILATSYRLYAVLYDKTGDQVKAQQYQNLYNEETEVLQEKKVFERTMVVEEEKLQKEKELQQATQQLKQTSKELKDKEKEKKVIEEEKQAAERAIEALQLEQSYKELEIKEKEAQLKIERLVRNGFIAGIVLLLILGAALLIAFRRNKEFNRVLSRQNKEIQLQKQAIEQQKNQIQLQNRQMFDSIRYAEKIQQALTPNINNIKAVVQEFFILFKPKDIVSGDFFWFANLGEYVIMVVADCTGHGVPGAFMSIIGHNLLNDIIHEKRIYEPSQILEQLHQGVRRVLQQENSVNDDGMDAIVCRIHKAEYLERKVVFAGAKRHLYLYTNDALSVVKGNSRAIGGRQKANQRPFAQHELVLHTGSMLYLTSDGFADQQNEQNEKFGIVRFQNMLGEIASESVKEQEKSLLKELILHQGKAHQRDDITVLGIRL